MEELILLENTPIKIERDFSRGLMKNKSFFLFLFVITILLAMSCSQKNTADLVLRGGKIATVDKHFSIQEAVAVNGDRIIFVGSNKDVKDFVGPKTLVIELNGKLVVPGMIDSHCHPFNLGKSGDKESFSVNGAKSFKQVVEMVAEKVKTIKPGEWLIGGGWYQNDWENPSLPIHDELSKVSPQNPIFLYRRGGNSSLVNQKAMDIAGITKDTPDPYGGKILRKANGEPTGVLVNMGNNIVKKHFPKLQRPSKWYREHYIRACRMCNEVGLTGWHDAGIDPIYIQAYKELVDRNELTVRVYAMLQNPRKGDLVSYFKKYRIINYGGKHLLTVRSVKIFFDGALGSRGAAFFKPYDDDPGNIGVFEVPPEHVHEVARAALQTGMQVCSHAIGIRGNSLLLDSYEKALKEIPVKDHRFRSEHAEVVRPEDVKRFASMGVIPSMQPIHCTSDMIFIENRIGKKRCQESASPWRSFINAGCIIPCGSDFSIYSHNPLTGIYAAITRQDKNGKPEGGWFPKERMTREEALKGYTIWAAYSAFQENILGSIEKGKLADFAVLDKNILKIEPMEILNTKVLYTIIGGKIVYENK